MATAASDSGSWSETQTETVSSIVGLEIARITEREGVAIWQATDHGRMVEPVPSATASRSVPSDSTSATMLGDLTDAGERRIDGPAHEVELARQHQRNAGQLGQRNGALGRAGEGHLDRRHQEEFLDEQRLEAHAAHRARALHHRHVQRPFMISSLKATAKPSTICSMTSGCASRAAFSRASDSVPPAL